MCKEISVVYMSDGMVVCGSAQGFWLQGMLPYYLHGLRSFSHLLWKLSVPYQTTNCYSEPSNSRKFYPITHMVGQLLELFGWLQWLLTQKWNQGTACGSLYSSIFWRAATPLHLAYTLGLCMLTAFCIVFYTLTSAWISLYSWVISL